MGVPEQTSARPCECRWSLQAITRECSAERSYAPAGDVGQYLCREANVCLWFANCPEFEAILDPLQNDSSWSQNWGAARQMCWRGTPGKWC